MTSVIWDEENTEHVAEHDLTPDEVDSVLLNESLPLTKSRSSGLPARIGTTNTGRHIFVTWEIVCEDPKMIYPVTAYDVPEQRSRSGNRKKGRTR